MCFITKGEKYVWPAWTVHAVMAEVCAAQKDPECKETSDKCCPVCAGCGRRSLILRQINAEEAIYVCENPACSYPVGYDATFIRRPILALLGGLGEKQGATNPSGKETDIINGKGIWAAVSITMKCKPSPTNLAPAHKT